MGLMCSEPCAGYQLGFVFSTELWERIHSREARTFNLSGA